MRHGVPSIEAFFSFETETARCSGIVRLVAAEPCKAWVLATQLDELKGHEEPVGLRRPAGSAYSRNFGGDNWSDNRAKAQAYDDHDPAVLIVGAGQAGLAIAARLGLLSVDTLLVDMRARVGDIWRERYHSLALHNQVKLNHMPYLPWPPNWPKYLPKDMIAGWLETYAWAMECNVWTSTAFLGAEYDDDAGHWTVRLRRADGTERVMKPKHLIMANGVAGRPLKPKLPWLDGFKGTVMHTHDYKDGQKWTGKKVLIVGAGTSGHDVAQDLHGRGALVKIIQRGPATVASVKAAGLVHSVYYEEDLPLEDCDMIAAASSYPMLVRAYQAAVEKMKLMDKDLLDGLAARGFKLDWGEDNTGHQMKFRRRHGGYYLNCGCSDLIVSGEIGILQHEDTDGFCETGLRMKDGSVEEADLIVLATGYQSQETVVREMLGDKTADRVGQIWGIAPNGEIASMFVATPQPGLWFTGGGFAHCRIYSHFIAMGIKVREMGFIS
jgi:putative flavoprotein involved in K+ transport